VLIGLKMVSCTQEDVVCPDTQLYDFKLILENKFDTSINRIKLYHPDLEDSIATEAKLPTLVNIPVNLNSDSTAFYIDFIDDSTGTRITDLIAFTYTNNSHLNNQECGFVMEFEIIKGYTSDNKIDSIVWINNKIDEDNEGNLEIYY